MMNIVDWSLYKVPVMLDFNETRAYLFNLLIETDIACRVVILNKRQLKFLLNL